MSLSVLYERITFAVTHASGIPGLGLIFVYGYFVAFILPLPSELGLIAPLHLGVGMFWQVVIIIVVTSLGKGLGSLTALHTGIALRRSDPVNRWFRNHVGLVDWSERESVELVERYGYVGLLVVLSIPFMPDTVPIYAMAVISTDYRKFAIATTLGSAIRLAIVAVSVIGLLQI